MGNIDDNLINALAFNDYEWIKKIVGFSRIKVEAEAYIGNKRCCDLLVTIVNYDGRNTQDVAIEVENDREFDASRILRKIKKDQPNPTVVIIPVGYENDAWRFQESLIKVWYWKARVKWKCQKCGNIFTTTSSVTPIKCKTERCQGRSNQLDYQRVSPEDVKFVEAENNPTESFGEIQRKVGRASVTFL